MRLIVPGNCGKFCDPHLNHSEEIRPKAVRGGICGSFFHDNFRPEVASDVMFGVVVERTRMDVTGKFGDSRSNRSRDIRAARFVMDEQRWTQVIA